MVGVGCGDLLESAAQIVREQGEVLFSEKGSEFFAGTMENRRKGKPFLACEGANVFKIGLGRKVGIQMSVTFVDGCHKCGFVVPVAKVCKCELGTEMRGMSGVGEDSMLGR